MNMTGETAQKRETRPFKRGFMAGLVCSVFMVCFALHGGTWADAAVTRNPIGQITEVPGGTGAPVPGPLSSVDALTFDTGHLWVAENLEGASETRTDAFGASGGFLTQLEPVAGLSRVAAVAVGHATGESDVYVGGIVGSRPGVAVFGASGALLGTWNGGDTPDGAFEPVVGVAVEGATGNWASGDVFVATSNSVDVFKPEAGGKESFVKQLTGPEPGVPFSGVAAIAVDDANGTLLVEDSAVLAGEETHVVDVFKPTGLQEFQPTRQITRPEEAKAIAVDSSDGHIYLSEGAAVVELDENGGLVARLTGVAESRFTELAGVAVDPATHRLYVGDRGREGGVVDIFGPDAVVPDIATGAVSELQPISATLNGSVNPDGAGEATCRFVWGVLEGPQQSVACSASVANGAVPASVHAALSGLAPDTIYSYRLQASNGNGSNFGAPGEAVTFTTPGPGIQDESISDVTAESATLQASVNPHGTATSYRIVLSAPTSTTDVPSTEGESLGSGEGAQQVSQHVHGLLPGTLYHYRVLVTSVLEGRPTSFEGPQRTFTTQGATPPVRRRSGGRWR